MIDPKTFAASTLALLQEDPRRYKLFGVHWYLVKEILRRFYSKDNLYLLGDYRDLSTVSNMPEYESLQDAITAAVEDYRQNASFNLGRSAVESPGGETILLFDQDAGM